MYLILTVVPHAYCSYIYLMLILVIYVYLIYCSCMCLMFMLLPDMPHAHAHAHACNLCLYYLHMYLVITTHACTLYSIIHMCTICIYLMLLFLIAMPHACCSHMYLIFLLRTNIFAWDSVKITWKIQNIIEKPIILAWIIINYCDTYCEITVYEIWF